MNSCVICKQVTDHPMRFITKLYYFFPDKCADSLKILTQNIHVQENWITLMINQYKSKLTLTKVKSFDMAFIVCLHCDKPNITYSLAKVKIFQEVHATWRIYVSVN